MFKGNRLCVPNYGTRELILREIHGGLLVGHFGEDKTYLMAKEHYFWPHMLKDIQDQEMLHMSNGQKSCTSSRALHPLAYSTRSLARCEHGLCIRSSMNPMQQGLDLGGGRFVFKDGTLHCVSQDK